MNIEDSPLNGSADAQTSAQTLHLKARPGLRALCREIDESDRFIDAGVEDTEAKVLAKLDAYSTWLSNNDLKPPRSNGLPHYGRVLTAVGHPGQEITPAIRRAIDALGMRFFFDGKAFRHEPERPIDVMLDAHQERVLTRGYGFPRDKTLAVRIRRAAAADDIGCAKEELDHIAMARIRYIDAMVPIPGPIYYPDDGITPANPAVPILIEEALDRFPDGLPQDPLHPKKVDLAVFADVAGVSVTDIRAANSNMRLIEEARMRQPLQPQPILNQRRYTFRELVDYGRNLRLDDPGNTNDPANAAKITVRALTQYREMGSGFSPDDLVPINFYDLVDSAIASKPSQVGSGWASQMRRWQIYNDALRSTKPLPVQFSTALNILIREVDSNRIILGKQVSATSIVQAWCEGRAVPASSSQPLLDKVEMALRVTKGTLTNMISDEWRYTNFSKATYRGKNVARTLPEKFRGMEGEEREQLLKKQYTKIIRQDTAYARRQSDVVRDEYLLKKDNWPVVMVEAWAAQTPEPEKKGLRRFGEQASAGRGDEVKIVKKRKDEWRPATILFGDSVLEAILGYFVRERELSPEILQRDWNTDFQPEGGLGIPNDLIHPVLFAVHDLMIGHAWWKARRSGFMDDAESSNLLAPFATASEFLRPKTGVVWKDETMIEPLERFATWLEENAIVTEAGPLEFDIQPFRSNWRKAVEDAYVAMRSDYKEVRKGRMPRSRNPFEPIEVFMSKKNPVEEYMVGVRHLLRSKPHNALEKHVHRRDCIMTLILVQTALRAATMLFTVEGEEPTLRKVENEDGSYIWRIVIPAKKFKNFDGPFFSKGEPYTHDLIDEDGLYEHIELYMRTSRRYLLAGNTSDDLFIADGGGTFDAAKLSAAYHRITARYFVYNEETGRGAIRGAMVHGPHAVRHIVATQIVKETGDLYLAAWAIQDSVKTVEAHYARFLPADKVQLAQRVLSRARQAGIGS